MRGTLAQIKEGALDGTAAVQTGVMARTAALSNPATVQRLVLFVAALVAPLYASGAAFAAKGGCDSPAAEKLFNFVDEAAKLMIGFGAVGALLMLAIGAGFIMFSAGNEGRARKGMTIVKNVVIALLIFGGGIFIKFIVLNFVGAATTFDAPKCVRASDTTAP
jgi:hypothetical protein